MRRSVFARPRLHHLTQVEAAVERERNWLLGTTAAATTFAVTLGGLAMAQVDRQNSTIAPHSSIANIELDAPPVALPPPVPSVAPHRAAAEAPILTAVSPASFDPEWFATDTNEELDDEDDLVIFDEPPPTPVVRTIARKPTEAPAPPRSPEKLNAIMPDSVAEAPPLGELPRAPPALQTAPEKPSAKLPPGFLPVAGLSVAPGDAPVRIERSSAKPTRTRSLPVNPFIDESGSELTGAQGKRLPIDSGDL